MAGEIETVKIEDGKGSYVVINKEDMKEGDKEYKEVVEKIPQERKVEEVPVVIERKKKTSPKKKG